jgi:hypothetical protein
MGSPAASSPHVPNSASSSPVSSAPQILIKELTFTVNDEGNLYRKSRILDKLASMASTSAATTRAIVSAGGVAPLVALAEHGTAELQWRAAYALGTITTPDTRAEVAKAGAIAPLVALAKGGTDESKRFAALALGSLADAATTSMEIVQAGGVAALEALGRSGTAAQKDEARFALQAIGIAAVGRRPRANHLAGVAASPRRAIAKAQRSRRRTLSPVRANSFVSNSSSRLAHADGDSLAPSHSFAASSSFARNASKKRRASWVPPSLRHHQAAQQL